MRFRVIRRSDWTKRDAPIEGAVKGTYRGRDVWFLEVKTLEDVMKIVASEGEVVIGQPLFEDEPPMIEIYDDYRE